MDKSTFSIPTRQKTDELFSTETPLDGTESAESAVREVAGYAEVAIFAVSDQAFTVTVEEACSPDGTFVETETFTSVVSGSANFICERFEPCGPFARFTVDNGATPQALLEVCVRGLPIA